MPNRKVGADALSRMLAELRDHAGIRQADGARQAGISQGLVAKFETGRQVPRPEQADALATVYQASPAQRREVIRLAEVMREGTKRVVVHRQYGALQKRVGDAVESSALIRTFSPIGIPGLFQTAQYVRALFTTDGVVTPDDEAGAAERLRNVRLLTDNPARQFIVVLPEGSLSWTLIPPTEMAEQIDHLADMSQRDNVQIGIIPWGRQADFLPLHSWEMYDERAVVVGTLTGTTFVTTPADVRPYLNMFSDLEQLAVYDDDCRALLRKVSDRYRQLI